MTTHFVCSGSCHGVSDHPGTCQALECDHYNEPLKACDCDNKQH